MPTQTIGNLKIPPGVVVYRPQEGPQEEFLASAEDEVLYGGAKGGGKTYALLMGATRQIANPKYKAIIFRRTYPKLQEVIERSHQMYRGMGAKWSGKTYCWTFPTGATIRFGHVQHEEDKAIYHGHEYHFMGFDQLEEFTESQYLFLLANNRSSVPGVFKEIRATANPGGIGHAWVHRRFMIDPKTGLDLPPRTVIQERYEVPFDLPYEMPDEIVRSRVFIPSTVYDNKLLLQNDPTYLANLLQLPEKERRAMLEGDWSVFAGQYFSEFTRTRHVIKPRKLPEHWLRFRCIDYGSTAPFAAYWCAVDEAGNVYVYREHYAAGFKAKESAAKMVQSSQEGDGDIEYAFSVVDPSVFNKTGQELSIGEILMDAGLTDLEPGNNDRLAGWQVFRERLRYDDSQENFKSPSIFIFETCRNLVRTLPSLVHDERHPEDLDSDGEDHAADAIRYGLMRLRDVVSQEKPKPTIETAYGLTRKHLERMGIKKQDPNRNPHTLH